MARESAAAKAKRLAEEAVAKVEEICGHCWPNGWPHGAEHASCEHGEFDRSAAAETPDPTPPAGGSDPETPSPSSATPDASTPATDPQA